MYRMQTTEEKKIIYLTEKAYDIRRKMEADRRQAGQRTDERDDKEGNRKLLERIWIRY